MDTSLHHKRQHSDRIVRQLAWYLFALVAAEWQVCDAGKNRPWRAVGEETTGARGLARMVTFQDMAFVLGGRSGTFVPEDRKEITMITEDHYLPVAAPMVMFDAGSNHFTVLNSSAGVDYSPPVSMPAPRISASRRIVAPMRLFAILCLLISNPTRTRDPFPLPSSHPAE